MKGMIILPTFYLDRWAPSGYDDFSKVSSAQGPIFYAIRDGLNFDLIYADEINIKSDIDIVIVFGVPLHNRPKMIPGLLELDKKIKMVVYPGDLQCYNNSLCLENRLKVFERADLIISGTHSYFKDMYPQFLYKYEFVPLAFGPHDNYMKVSFNDTPKYRCLLSGAKNPTIYPLRTMISKNKIDVLDSRNCGYAKGDNYIKLLNSYFCCVATSSIFNYAVAKYFEIPAVGSLLIADEIEDLIRAGFVANKHYVPITKTNAVKVIKECVANPGDYNGIRKLGMEYVRENHSVLHRVKTIKLLFEELFNK